MMVLYILIAIVALAAFIGICWVGFGAINALPMLVFLVADALTRLLAHRRRLSSLVLYSVAAVRGIVAAWIIYLASFLARDLEMARSLRQVLLFLGSIGLMYAVMSMMRACVISQNAAMPWDSSDGPVVLLLRRFSTDGIFRDDAGLMVGAQALSEEQEIAELLERANLGRFVALAHPDAPAQELGAHRIDIGSRNWKEVVANYLSRANAIVMRLGATESMLWELDAVVSANKADRTLFMLPPATSEEDLWRKYDAITDKIANRPGYPPFPSTPPSRTRFIHFGERGPEYLRDEEKGKADMTRLLSPFFTKLGVSPPRRHMNADAIFALVVKIFVGCYLLAVWYLGFK